MLIDHEKTLIEISRAQREFAERHNIKIVSVTDRNAK